MVTGLFYEINRIIYVYLPNLYFMLEIDCVTQLFKIMCNFSAYLHNLQLSALHHKCSKQLMLSKQTNEPIHSASVIVLEPLAK